MLWIILGAAVFLLLFIVVLLLCFKNKVIGKVFNKVSAGEFYNIYRTQDGKAYFIFRYVNTGYHYEIDILSQPSYGVRSSGLHATHRLPAKRPGAEFKICIYDSHAPRQLDKAMKVSMDWAELTWNYINTGVGLDEQLRRR